MYYKYVMTAKPVPGWWIALAYYLLASYFPGDIMQLVGGFLSGWLYGANGGMPPARVEWILFIITTILYVALLFPAMYYAMRFLKPQKVFTSPRPFLAQVAAYFVLVTVFLGIPEYLTYGFDHMFLWELIVNLLILLILLTTTRYYFKHL